MNNRKQSNLRGKSPRSLRTQIIPESPTIKNGEKDSDGKDIRIPNPDFGKTRTIIHRNI